MSKLVSWLVFLSVQTWSRSWNNFWGNEGGYITKIHLNSDPYQKTNASTLSPFFFLLGKAWCKTITRLLNSLTHAPIPLFECKISSSNGLRRKIIFKVLTTCCLSINELFQGKKLFSSPICFCIEKVYKYAHHDGNQWEGKYVFRWEAPLLACFFCTHLIFHPHGCNFFFLSSCIKNILHVYFYMFIKLKFYKSFWHISNFLVFNSNIVFTF